MIKIKKTKLPGVILIEPGSFRDERGRYIEIYNRELYAAHGVRARFIQDDISVSKKRVLRGIHGDRKTWKLVSCLRGVFFLVIVNCDKGSKLFGRWVSFTLSEERYRQVLVPPKHGVAHLALSDKIIFHYKQSTYYDRAAQFTYRYDDPRFNIRWPVKDPILSDRDRNA